MTVYVLWSAPRSRSTAFFRSMAERGDLTVAHEPFNNIASFGATEVDGQTFNSAPSLLRWLADRHDDDTKVFVKETTDRRYDAVLDDQDFLLAARHGFLIRHPAEVAASFYALDPSMGLDDVGLEALHQLYEAVGVAQRNAGLEADASPPVVVDSDDLISQPAETLAAYCAAVGLEFVPDALAWSSGDRAEWHRTNRWHTDVSSSTGFRPVDREYADTVETSPALAAIANHHLPFYDALRAKRLRVTS